MSKWYRSKEHPGKTCHQLYRNRNTPPVLCLLALNGIKPVVAIGALPGLSWWLCYYLLCFAIAFFTVRYSGAMSSAISFGLTNGL